MAIDRAAVPDDPSAKVPLRTWLRCRVENILILFGLMAGVATITAFAGRFWWAFDLTAHFRMQYLGGLAVIAAAMMCFRRRRLAIVFLALGLVNLATVVPQYVSAGPTTIGTGEGVRLMLINVHTRNTRSDLVAAEIARHDPDILVLQEVDQRWLDDLAEVTAGYASVVTRSRSDNFGIAVCSRYAMSSRVLDVGSTKLPSIVGQVEIGDVGFTLLATHPFPPKGEAGSARRNRQFTAISEFVAELEGPVIVLGDLNATPWSAPFRALLRDAGLHDASRGHGIHATWPTNLPLMLIPIDQCLHSADVVVVDETVGGRVGSDHYPLIVDVVIGEGGGC